jgi:hypothetical protein
MPTESLIRPRSSLCGGDRCSQACTAAASWNTAPRIERPTESCGRWRAHGVTGGSPFSVGRVDRYHPRGDLEDRKYSRRFVSQVEDAERGLDIEVFAMVRQEP